MQRRNDTGVFRHLPGVKFPCAALWEVGGVAQVISGAPWLGSPAGRLGVFVLFGGVFLLLGCFLFFARQRDFFFFFEGLPHRNGEFPLCSF